MPKRKKFYISTALPYVNYAPHLGFALEAVQADVVARFRRNLGDDVFFLTGTDENSLKNVQSAAKEGVEVKELVAKNADKFYQLKKMLNLSVDDFIRTTEERHFRGAQKLWLACKKDIYKKKYKGLYCVGCEEFYKETELENGLCREHKTKPEPVEEEDYFFRLSNYQEKLKKLIEKDGLKIVPETRKNEILSFLNSGLEDVCISRSAGRAHGWGIPVPGDPNFVQWVWFDALSNYINALGYGAMKTSFSSSASPSARRENGKKFREFWQENKNKLHVIGKGIVRFHALYWPAMLLSAKLALPNAIFVHGYLTSGGQKMSKSLGNVIDPFELVKRYGTDAVRYFLLREIPATEDGDFTQEKFEQRYNADLAKGLGNLVARTMTMAKNSKFEIQNTKQIQNPKLKTLIDKTPKKYRNALNEFKFNEALIAIWDLIGFCDKYIERERPWEEKPGRERVIGDLLFAISNVAEMIKPFLPETSEKIVKQIKTKKSDILFPRLK